MILSNFLKENDFYDKQGSLNIISSKEGMGKTSSLMELSCKYLIENKKIIHICFNKRPSNIINHYIFFLTEFAGDNLKNELLENKIILNYRMNKNISKIYYDIMYLMSETHFQADFILIDGYNFKKEDIDFKFLKNLTKIHNINIWISIDKSLEKGILKEENIDLIITLEEDIKNKLIKILESKGI